LIDKYSVYFEIEIKPAKHYSYKTIRSSLRKAENSQLPLYC